METCHWKMILRNPLKRLLGPLGFAELTLGTSLRSVICVVTGLRVGPSGFRIPVAAGYFSVSQNRLDPICEPPIRLFNECRGKAAWS